MFTITGILFIVLRVQRQEKLWQRIARKCRWREKKDANETTKTRNEHSSQKRLG